MDNKRSIYGYWKSFIIILKVENCLAYSIAAALIFILFILNSAVLDNIKKICCKKSNQN